MPYVLLIIGLLFAVVALYRFFLAASAQQVKSAFLAVVAIAVFCAAIFLTLTGRLAAALGVLIALWPLLPALFRQIRGESRASSPSAASLSKAEAREVLGVGETATPDEIQEAYIKLMKKTHPDHDGSAWLAQKINLARDILLRK